MLSRFSADTSVSIPVPDAPVSVDGYLRDTDRLVNLLGNPRRIQKTGSDTYRIALAPLSFVMLDLQPIVDLRIWTEPNGTLRLQSIGYEVKGVDYIQYGFTLELSGRLYPTIRKGSTTLVGRAMLKVGVQLPPILQFTPQSVIDSAGSALLSGILATISSRLHQHLIPDYASWAEERDRQVA
ncbi:MAG: DUF1997 domain-containing protein [Geitlerinemataceae cyanobacterium]